MEVSELTTKTNAFEVSDPSTQVSAEEYNAIVGEIQKVPETVSDVFFEQPEVIIMNTKSELTNGLIVRHPFLAKDEECEIVLMRYAFNKSKKEKSDGSFESSSKRGWVEARPLSEDGPVPALTFGPYSNIADKTVLLNKTDILDRISQYLYERTIGDIDTYRFAKQRQRKMFGLALRRVNPRFGGTGDSQMWSMGQCRYEYSRVAKILACYTGKEGTVSGVSLGISTQ